MSNANQQGIDEAPKGDGGPLQGTDSEHKPGADTASEDRSQRRAADVQGPVPQRDLWTLVMRFFGHYPEAGVLAVVIALYPLFNATLPPQKTSASLVWFMLILVGSIAFLRIIRRVFEPTDPGERFRRFLSRAVAVVILAPFAAMSLAVVLALLFPGQSFGAIGRLADLLFDAERPDVSKNPPQVSPAPSLPVPSVPEPLPPSGTSKYDECLSRAFGARDQGAIIDCVKHLPK